MASRRMVPTKYFKDPDIMNLESKDSQLILLGLILAADDEGREVAHARLLGRELDYPPETIERALQDLVANELLVLYQVGKHRYYSLTRWQQWQTLGGRFTPSRYPAPPATTEEPSTQAGECSGKIPENPSEIGENPAQFNVSEFNVSKSNRSESNGVGGQEESPSNITPFPTSTCSDDSAIVFSQEQIQKTTKQVAHILKLPETEALVRIVQDYHADPSLSLLGEADAAREWIDDPLRNKKHKHMTLAFFRHWLQRERDTRRRREAERAANSLHPVEATGTMGRIAITSSSLPAAQGGRQANQCATSAPPTHETPLSGTSTRLIEWNGRLIPEEQAYQEGYYGGWERFLPGDDPDDDLLAAAKRYGLLPPDPPGKQVHA